MKTVLSLRKVCATSGCVCLLRHLSDTGGGLCRSMDFAGPDLAWARSGYVHRLALLASLVLVGFGCTAKRGATAPAAVVTLPSGAVLNQSGDAQAPASVSTTNTTTSTPVAAGTTVTIDPQKPGLFTFTLAKDGLIKTETRTEKAEAPRAFTPPAPPTLQDESEAKLLIYYRIGVVVGIAAGLFGLVRDYQLLMIGGGIVAAACLAALFIQKHPVLTALIGGGAALAVVGPALWHFHLKHLQLKQP